jgi:hypothetical protein
MADYYSVLARAISRLSDSNARKRHEIYERARAVVLEELSKLDPEKVAPEQAQLEAAILRLEAEASARDAAVAAAPPPQATPRPATDVAMAAAPPSPPQAAPRPAADVTMAAAPPPQAAPPPAADGAMATAPPPQPVTDVTPAPQRRPASGYFGAIFRSPRRAKPVQQTPPAPAPAQAPQGSAGGRPAAKAPDELAGMLNSLRTMLFGTAFLVAVLAFTGVVYVRGLIWVAAGAITYSGLLVVTAAAFILSLAVAVSIFRSASSLPGFGLLSRLIHSASRRVF